MALRLNSVQIIDNIINNNFTFLEPFSGDEKEIDNWKSVLRKVVIEDGNLKTADKAKQLYFPVPTEVSSKPDNPYHLVVPLFASSLADQIHAVVTQSKYGESQKQVNKFRRSEPPKFHNDTYLNYLNLGSQKVGGDYPRNVSMLNADRSGLVYLFSTQPPTWETQLNPPIYRKSLFDYLSNLTINTELDYLRDFLLRFKQLDLSIKDPKRMRHLERWVNTIIDEFLFYVGSIQNLPSGWSDRQDINLKKEHQYLLDPYRMDEVFQSARQGCDWQAVIRADFAMWLNRRLRGKQFTPQKEHTRLWKKLLETPLREFMEPIEIEVKQQARESV
jgi:CRISPR-associated protein Csy1